MMDLHAIKEANKRAARTAERTRIQPAEWTGDLSTFRVPYIGDHIPVGWKRTNRKPYFVDLSGFGQEDEPAMTLRALVERLRVGYGYALTEVGQFQGYVAEYQRV